MTMPSVTTVLGPFSDFSRVRPDVLAHAADRGFLVHAACCAHARGLWVPAMRDDVWPFVDSFRRWFESRVVEVVATEYEVSHPEHGYCGHPDFLGRLEGDELPRVVDWKTPAALKKVWKAQVVAYRHATERTLGVPVGRVGILRLKKDGSRALFCDVPPEEQAQHFGAFLSALNAYRWFKE